MKNKAAHGGAIFQLIKAITRIDFRSLAFKSWISQLQNMY